jgi:hypothetical protein
MALLHYQIGEDALHKNVYKVKYIHNAISVDGY